MLTHGKLLLVEYNMEQEKWDIRFGFIKTGRTFKNKLSETEIYSFTWLMGFDGPSFMSKEGVYVVTTPMILMKLYANVDHI